MASLLKVDALTGVTTAGSISVTGEGNSTTTNLQQGLAKAWSNFNGTGTVATRDSFNQASLTDNGTADYTVAFTASLGNTNFCFNGTSSGDSGNYGYTFIQGQTIGQNEFVYATNSIRLATGYASATNSTASGVDAHQVNVSVSGDLA